MGVMPPKRLAGAAAVQALVLAETDAILAAVAVQGALAARALEWVASAGVAVAAVARQRP